MTDDVDGRGLPRALAFMGVYYLMTIVSLGVHIWVTAHGWAADGMWWGLGYFALFIYAELYWCVRAFLEDGLSLFVVASGFAGLWWVALLLFLKKLSAWLVRAGSEE